MRITLVSLLIFMSGVIGLGLQIRDAFASGGELRELYRGARAQAFGNAFTAVADDEEALFYNPAGLAGIQKTSFNYATLDTEVSGDIIASPTTLSNLLSNASTSSLNALMGQDIYTRAMVTPTLVMPHFGVGMIMDEQIALLAKNTALPSVTAALQTTNGVQFGTGWSVNSRRKNAENFTDVRLGVGGKILWRRGGYRTLTPTQMLAFTGMSSQDALNSLAGDYGMGYGIDFGTQVVRNVNSRLSLSWGAAWTEIGDVKFASSADPQKGNLSTGIAARYSLPAATLGLAYDYRHILDDTDWKMRTHLGGYLELPFVSIYAGINQMHPTYGAAFDAWLFRVTAESYAEEIGVIYGQESERRYLIRLAMKFGL